MKSWIVSHNMLPYNKTDRRPLYNLFFSGQETASLNKPKVPPPSGAILPEPVDPQNKYLWLYKIKPEGSKNTWWFTHHPNSYGSLFVLPISENKDGEKCIFLLKSKRPSMDGRVTVEVPAGAWGDTGEESIEQTAIREASEETGLDIQKVKRVTNQFFPIAPAVTTTKLAFTLVEGSGNYSSIHQDQGEKFIIQDVISVPLETFMDHDKFHKWLNDMDKAGYLVNMSVLAMRGLLANSTNKLDILV